MKNENLVWNHYLSFRATFGLSITMQVCLVVGLFLLQSYSAYWLIDSGNNYAGVPVEWSGILAPIYEEIIFRGVILALLVSKVGVKKGIIYSALLFGLWHFRNIIYVGLTLELFSQIFYASIFGLLLAWGTIKIKSIWPAVMLHYANNILAPISWLMLGLI